MDLELDQFRDVDLVIDYANYTFIEKQFVSQGDYKGRTLTVLVTNKGVVGEVPGLVLNLNWHNEASGLTDLSAFSVLDKANSIYRIEYPQHMMTPGRVIASIQVIQDGKVTNLKQFELTVQKLAGNAVGIVEKAEFSALVAVLADANEFRSDIDVLGNNKVDKGGTGQVTPSMLSQSAIDLISNGAVTNLGISGVNTYNVADKAINSDKTDFIIKSPISSNHYDTTNSIYGYYISANTGKLTANDNYKTTGSIPIPTWATKVARSNAEQFVFKDENYNFIEGDSTTASSKYRSIPSGAKYVECSVRLDYADDFRVAFINAVQTETMPSFEPFRATYTLKSTLEINDLTEKVVISNNHFDPANVKQGFYAHWASGFPIANTDYYIATIPVPSWAKKVAKSYSEQCAFLKSTGEYAGGNSTATNNTYFDIPDGSSTMLCSIKTAQLDNFYVYFINASQPETIPAYDTFKYKYVLKGSDNENAVSEEVKVPTTFPTITGAINYINSNYDAFKTIEVSPGTYKESIAMKATKIVDIVSKNKQRTVIRDDSGAYEKSPFSGSGNGYFQNLTFLATHDDVLGALPSKTAYAAHIDYVGEGTLVFEDCDFISYQNSAVGIGTHENQTIIFRRCSFRNNTLPANDGGALYFHNAVTNGVENQKLIFEDCTIVSETGLYLRIDDANLMNGGTGSLLDVTFLRCNFFSNVSGASNSGLSLRAGSGQTAEGCIIGNIKLNKRSTGNNISKLNAY